MTDFLFRLKSTSEAVYAMAGKDGGSDMARRTDVTVYSLSELQLAALEGGRQKAAEYAEQRRFAKTLQISAERKENSDTSDSVSMSEPPPVQVGTVSKTQLNARKQRYISRKKRENFALYADGNFGMGDLFVTLTLAETAISDAEVLKDKFISDLRRWYRLELGADLKWMYVIEFGDKNGRKHYHFFINVVDKKYLWLIRAEIRKLWKGNGRVHISTINRKMGHLVAYCVKRIGDNHELYAHDYHKSKNLVKPVTSEPINFDRDEFYRLFAIARKQGIDGLWRFIESLPETAAKRVTRLEVHDREGETPSLSFSFIDVSDEVAAGCIGKYRGVADLEYFEERGAVTLIGVIDEAVYVGAWDDRDVVAPYQPYFQSLSFKWKIICERSRGKDKNEAA